MKTPAALTILAEGKTKIIWSTDQRGVVIVESKNDLTAGDGAKHDVVEGKGKLANQTTSNVFRLLQTCGLPVAFIKQIDEKRFLAEQCEMIPLEVVVRRETHGSYLKRYPYLPKGFLFPKLVLEFFLKTSGKKFGEIDLPKDDPLIDLKDNHVDLYLPDQPIQGQTPFYSFTEHPLLRLGAIPKMGLLAIKTFLILEKAWQLVGRKLVDFKVEFGYSKASGHLCLADVIDNDSWRVIEGENYIDKQVYRDGGDIKTVANLYQQVAELTGLFRLPQQRLIIWRGSNGDDLTPFTKALADYFVPTGCVETKNITHSAHKESVASYMEVTLLAHEVPDSVVIAYAGMSNGLGPTLSAQVTVPVITVPVGWSEFPEDIWSSLRTPSDVPVSTNLNPKNAVLQALRILSMRNPWLYAILRQEQEYRLSNVLKL